MSEELDHFSVVYRFQRKRAAIFSGTEEAVYDWLKKPLQIDIWEVYNHSAEVYEHAQVFLDRLAEKYKPKAPLTEEDVRRIVDQRVGEILESMAKRAEDQVSGLAAYEVSDIMKPAFSAIQEILENMVGRLDSKKEG